MNTPKDYVSVVNAILGGFITTTLLLVYLEFVLSPDAFIATVEVYYLSIVAFLDIPTYYL